MLVPVTAIYAALLGLIGLTLTVMVGYVRDKTDVSLGDGGNPVLLEAMRRQANFVERVPLALLLIALLELNGASASWIHGLGGALVVCRILHPIGIRADRMRVLPRGIGALGTLLVELTAIGLLLWRSLASPGA